MKKKSIAIIVLSILVCLLVSFQSITIAEEADYHIADISSYKHINLKLYDNCDGIIINETQFKNNKKEVVDYFNAGGKILVKDQKNNNILGHEIIGCATNDINTTPIIAQTEKGKINKNILNYVSIMRDTIFNNDTYNLPTTYAIDYNFTSTKYIESYILAYANNKSYHVASIRLRYNFFEYLNETNRYYYFFTSNILVSPNTATSRSFRLDKFNFDVCLYENSSAHFVEEKDNSMAKNVTTSYGESFNFNVQSNGNTGAATTITFSCSNTSPADSLSKNMSPKIEENGEYDFYGTRYTLTPNNLTYKKSFTWDYACSILANDNDIIGLSLLFNGLGITGMGWDPNFEASNTDCVLTVVSFNNGNLSEANGIHGAANLIGTDKSDDYFEENSCLTDIVPLG